MHTNKQITASVIGIERLRENIDGPGLRTLVLLSGCPLHCEYCLNKMLLESGIQKDFTPEELHDVLSIDSPYYRISDGGVTFGGGEPALHSKFIKEFYEVATKYGDELDVRIETSLNVPLKHIQLLAPFVSKFYVDIKDMNTEIYCDYTHDFNCDVLDNLKWLSKNGYTQKVLARVPLIPEFNTEEDREESIKILHEMGFETEKFEYIKTREPFQMVHTMGIPAPPDYPDDLMGDLKPDDNDLFKDDEREG